MSLSTDMESISPAHHGYGEEVTDSLHPRYYGSTEVGSVFRRSSLAAAGLIIATTLPNSHFVDIRHLEAMETLAGTYTHEFELQLRDVGYIIENDKEVAEFINRNSDADEWLKVHSRGIAYASGSHNVVLEYFYDAEEDFERLFVIVNLDDEQFAQVDVIEAEVTNYWITHLDESLRSKIAFSIV